MTRDGRDEDERGSGDGAAEGPAGESQGSGRAGSGPLVRLKELWSNPAYRFVMLFLPYLGAVSIGYPIFVKRYHGLVQTFILATAKIEYWLFVPFSSAISLDQKQIVFGGFGVKIIDECTGIYEMLIFSAAVLAFPTSWRSRLIGIAMGNPLIYLFNVLRIAMLIVVGRFWSQAFDFMHLYFWQATMILMITSVWLLWILKVVRSEEDSPPPPA